MKAIFTLATVLLFLLYNSVYQPKMAASVQPIVRQEAATKPGPRMGHSLVYDTQLRRVILLSGYGLQHEPTQEEVWSWNGKQWQLIPDSGPRARTLSGGVYDSRRSRIVLYGGFVDNVSRGDIWEWDGQRWQEMADTSIGTRDHHCMAYDTARGKTVLYGGTTATASGPSWVTDT